MDGGLSECFSDDGGLFEFDAKAEVDQWMEKACGISELRSSIVISDRGVYQQTSSQASRQSFIAREEIFVHDRLPTFLVHFRFEKGHEVVEISART